MSDDLLAQANAATGGQELWKTLRALRIDISIGGPIWAMKGWPPDGTFDQMVTLDTARERIVFTPFPRPDRRMIFGAAVPAAPARGRCAGPASESGILSRWDGRPRMGRPPPEGASVARV